MNREIWDKVKRPPVTALKTINGGRLNGKSDINPIWRYEIMTEIFGMCGQGWKYTIDKKWLEPVTDGQVVAFADITLYFFNKETSLWSEGIPANGGSMLIEKEKAGLHSSDEAYKMAITDALGTAMKMLGVAADIYAGKWDGSKYINDKKQDEKTTQAQKTEKDSPASLGEAPQENIVFCTIKGISSKQGTSATGPWKLFIVETEIGDKYGTFSAELADIATTLKNSGEMGRLEFKQGKKNKEIVSLVAGGAA